jgi:hypothetical protein
MKIGKYIALFFILIIPISIHAQDTISPKGPRISFDEKVKDYGDIVYGDSISYTFKFTNTGNEDLIISDIKTTCSCTTRKYTEGPIAPGKQGEMTVSFNSKNQDKTGRQRKAITVISNAVNNYEQVIFICNVLEK